MKICFFHLMPDRLLPDDFENDYRSVWVDVPQSLYDAGKVHGLYSEFRAGNVAVQVEQIERLSAMGKFVWPIPDKGLKKRLHRLTAPALLLWGDGDRVNPPAYAAEFARRMRGAQVRELPGGHMVHLESPGAVARETAELFA